MNCEDPYLAEGFLHNLSSCFDIIFAQLRVIARTWNKIAKIVAASECYFIINPLKKGIKEAAVPNIPSHKINLRKNFYEKRKSFLAPNLQYY